MQKKKKEKENLGKSWVIISVKFYAELRVDGHSPPYAVIIPFIFNPKMNLESCFCLPSPVVHGPMVWILFISLNRLFVNFLLSSYFVEPNVVLS